MGGAEQESGNVLLLPFFCLPGRFALCRWSNVLEAYVANLCIKALLRPNITKSSMSEIS